MEQLAAARPYYAKLLRLQAKLKPEEQCTELKETIAAHRALDEALEAARRPGATEREGMAPRQWVGTTWRCCALRISGYEPPPCPEGRSRGGVAGASWLHHMMYGACVCE